MIRYKDTKLSPFDRVELKQETKSKQGFGDLFRKNFYLSTRACVFMLGYSLTLACLVASFGRMYIPILLALLCVIVWTFTFRFAENCRTIPLNIFLNTSLIAGLYLLPKVSPDPVSFYSYVPLLIGLTALSSSIRDGRAYFTRCSISEEIVIPGVIGSFCVLVAAVISKFAFEKKSIGVMLIITAVMSGLTALAFSKAIGQKVRMTSSKLIDVHDYHPVNKEENAGFLMGRVVFAGETVAVLAGMLAMRISDMKFSLDLSFALYPIAASLVIIIFILIAGRRFDDIFACESLLIIAVLPLMPSVIGVIITIAVDIVLTGFLHTYKRRKLFADINTYFDGLPMLMAVLGITIMLVETVAR
ncbi:hypothetical protein SAMN06296952_1481 [Oscillospiraceae bacterium]|nr:hypothetical protein SAMN06296952_1481 [Oscillospiraceae bacterium]